MFATVTGILCAFLIVKDRRDELHRVEELTSSLARMVMAHGDATLDTAESTLVSIRPSVERWDMRDMPQGYELYRRLRDLIGASGQQSVAWITDGNGIGVLETTDYPSKRLNSADGAYFKAHLAAAVDRGDPSAIKIAKLLDEEEKEKEPTTFCTTVPILLLSLKQRIIITR